MRSLADFKDLYRGETILVCGCGASLSQLRDPERSVTIGVNDVGRKFHPDYLVVVNPRHQFSGDRFRYVENSKAKFIFTQLDLGLTNSNIVKFRLGRRGGTEVKADILAVPYTNISPYVALCLARFMGARRIGVIGVDFTDDHFFGPTGRHPLSHSLRRIDAELQALAAAFAQDGIELRNLSATSALTAFPKASMEQFLIGPIATRGSRSDPSPLRIVSYAKTPVAGVPPILARCINAQTSHRCECVWQRSSYGNGVSFQGGTESSRDPQKADELLAAADVVIVHNGHVASQHRRILDAKPVVTMAHNYAWNVDFGFVERGHPGVVVGQVPGHAPGLRGLAHRAKSDSVVGAGVPAGGETGPVHDRLHAVR